MPPPDLVVYMRRSVPCLQERIAQRGRDYEKNIPDSYLDQLNVCYDEWIEKYQIGKVLTVQADNLDLKNKKEDFDYVCSRLEQSLEQPDLFSTC
jgi:deoxyadenosine/deoxycytidine kinase